MRQSCSLVFVWLLASALVFGVLSPGPVGAQEPAGFSDEIELNDGSKIVGRILTMGGGSLEVETQSAGTVKLAFADVKAIRSSQDHVFQLKDGSEAVGKPRVGSSGGLEVETGTLGSLPIQMGDVEAINPPEVPSVTHKGFVQVAGSVTDGNTRTKTANAQAEYVARGDRHRLTMRGGWNYAQDEDGLSARNANGAMKYDFFATEKLFLYANATFAGDDFADLNLRTTIGAGAGYQFFDNAEMQYYEELGVSFYDEDFESNPLTPTVDPDDRFAAGRLSGQFDWHIIADKLKFFHFHELFFGFESEDDVFANTRTGFRLNIIENFYATVQVNYQWDNTPAAGNRRNDTVYLWGLGYSFDF